MNSLPSFVSLIRSQAKKPDAPRWLFDNAEIERRHKTHAEVIGPFIEQWAEDEVYGLADTANQILENPSLSTLEKQAMLNDLEELAVDTSLWRKLVHGEPRKPVLSLPSRPKKPKAA